MFENNDNIQKNKKIIAILVISGFILGLTLSRFFSSGNTEVVRINLDQNFKAQTYQSSSQEKSNRNKE